MHPNGEKKFADVLQHKTDFETPRVAKSVRHLINTDYNLRAALIVEFNLVSIINSHNCYNSIVDNW